MAGYAQNGFRALHADMSRKLRREIIRAERWKASYGEVGCYSDLLATCSMFKAVVDALEYWNSERPD